jgi:hypothetical protein
MVMNPMNQYGTQAQKHWRRTFPQVVSLLPDPEEFFAELGTVLAEKIYARTEQLVTGYPPADGYQQNLAVRNSAQMSAEDEIMRRLVFLERDQDPEPTMMLVTKPELLPDVPLPRG